MRSWLGTQRCAANEQIRRYSAFRRYTVGDGETILEHHFHCTPVVSHCTSESCPQHPFGLNDVHESRNEASLFVESGVVVTL